jgi:hypothetical protein
MPVFTAEAGAVGLHLPRPQTSSPSFSSPLLRFLFFLSFLFSLGQKTSNPLARHQ